MLNNVAIMGRLTDTPDLRHTPNNTAVTNFTLAVSRNYGEHQTDFIDCVAWQKTAEFICKYFQKGQMMAAVGSLQTRTWKDKEGNNRKNVEIEVREVYFVEKKEKNEDFTEVPAGSDLPF